MIIIVFEIVNLTRRTKMIIMIFQLTLQLGGKYFYGWTRPGWTAIAVGGTMGHRTSFSRPSKAQ